MLLLLLSAVIHVNANANTDTEYSLFKPQKPVLISSSAFWFLPNSIHSPVLLSIVKRKERIRVWL